MAKSGNISACVLVLAISCTVVSVALATSSLGDRTRIMLDLREKYSRMKHINLPSNSIYIINTTMLPFVIHEINEADRYMETRVIFVLRWQDDDVGWDASEYGNISTAYVESEILWLPDMGIDNCVDEHACFDRKQDQIVVNSDGTVQWSSHKLMRTLCDTNVLDFPFDVQNCSIAISTMNSNDLGFKFKVQKVILDYFQQSSEWLTSPMTYTSVLELRSYVVMHFHLRRRSVFYILRLIMPSILLSFLNLAVFLLPGESRERVAMSVTAMLSTAFLSFVGDITPANSKNVPVIAWFILLHLVFAALTTTCNIISLNLFFSAQGNEKEGHGKKSAVDCKCCCLRTQPAAVEPFDSLPCTEEAEGREVVKTRGACSGLLAGLSRREHVFGCFGSTFLDKLMFYVLFSATTLLTAVCLGSALC